MLLLISVVNLTWRIGFLPSTDLPSFRDRIHRLSWIDSELVASPFKGERTNPSKFTTLEPD
jgi:hypothetical protein